MTPLKQIHWENLKVGDHLVCSVTAEVYRITAMEPRSSAALDHPADDRGNLIYYRLADAPLHEVECRGHLEIDHLHYVGSVVG